MRVHGVRKVLVAVGVIVAAAVPIAMAAGSPAGAASSNGLNVTAGEYTYKMSGSPKPGNVEISFKNGGDELHMMAVIQLKPGVTLKQLNTALKSSNDSAMGKLTTGQGFNVPGTPNVSLARCVDDEPREPEGRALCGVVLRACP